MPQMQNAQSVALQLEKVRDKLPLLYERDDILLTMIQQRGDVEKVSSSATCASRCKSVPEAKPVSPTWTAATWAAARAPFTTSRKSRRYFSGTRSKSPSSSNTPANAPEKADRERRQARSEKRHGAVPLVPRQSDADQRQRRARHDQPRSLSATTFTMAKPPGARARLLQPDDPGVRLHAHHQSRLVPTSLPSIHSLADSRSTRFPPAPSPTT